MKPHDYRRTNLSAFTLVELLVVIAIISIMVLMLLPAINAARESARRAQCMARMGQIGVALHNFEMQHEFFPAGVRNPTGPILNRSRGLHHSWTIAILPHLDEANLYAHIDPDVSVYNKKHADLANRFLLVFSCPSSAVWGAGATSYAAVHHDREAPIDSDNNGVFYLNSNTTRDDISDGLQYTFFLGEKCTDLVSDRGWMSGTRATLRNTGHVIGVAPKILSSSGSSVEDFSINPDDDPPLVPPFDPNVELTDQPDSLDDETIAPETISPETSEIESSAEITADAATEAVIDKGDEIDELDEIDATAISDDKASTTASGLSIEKAVAAGLYVGGFGSDHPGGALFVYGDGSVRFIPQSIDMNVYRNFGNRKDGQLIDNEALR